jgi:hypothetical protein
MDIDGSLQILPGENVKNRFIRLMRPFCSIRSLTDIIYQTSSTTVDTGSADKFIEFCMKDSNLTKNYILTEQTSSYI